MTKTSKEQVKEYVDDQVEKNIKGLIFPFKEYSTKNTKKGDKIRNKRNGRESQIVDVHGGTKWCS